MFDKEYKHTHERRFNRTIDFMKKSIVSNCNILDLGPENPFSIMMKEKGYVVTNTSLDIDLDLDWEVAKDDKFDVVTAFEIFEHLVAPFNVLKDIKAKKLLASVPLKLWFSNAYWNEKDSYDRHYHEFEPRQFDMLLEKSGWEIKDSEQWTSPANKLGIRPLLRKFVPRHYIVYCERK